MEIGLWILAIIGLFALAYIREANKRKSYVERKEYDQRFGKRVKKWWE